MDNKEGKHQVCKAIAEGRAHVARHAPATNRIRHTRPGGTPVDTGEGIAKIIRQNGVLLETVTIEPAFYRPHHLRGEVGFKSREVRRVVMATGLFQLSNFLGPLTNRNMLDKLRQCVQLLLDGLKGRPGTNLELINTRVDESTMLILWIELGLHERLDFTSRSRPWEGSPQRSMRGSELVLTLLVVSC